MAAQAQLAGTTSVPAAAPCNALRVVVLAAIAAGFTSGAVSFDLAAYKRFRITERIETQFRVEAFNALNTPSIGSPNVQVGNRASGSITSAGRPRNLQLGIKDLW